MPKPEEYLYSPNVLHMDSTPISHAARLFLADTGISFRRDYYDVDVSRYPRLEVMDRLTVIKTLHGFDEIVAGFPETKLSREIKEYLDVAGILQPDRMVLTEALP